MLTAFVNYGCVAGGREEGRQLAGDEAYASLICYFTRNCSILFFLLTGNWVILVWLGFRVT